RVDPFDPVVMLVHLAWPIVGRFADQGKARVTLPDEVRDALDRCVRSVASPWKKEKRSADRQDRLDDAALERQRKAQRPRRLSLKEAADQVMERAYLETSDNKRFPANARQIMYKARPLVLERTGGECWKKSSYFTQHLLPDFLD